MSNGHGEKNFIRIGGLGMLTSLVLLWIWCGTSPGAAQSPQRGPARSPHGPLQLACENCHTSTNWAPLRPAPDFDHQQTGYPLRGLHQRVNCRNCHTTLVFKDAGANCADCHADIHMRSLGTGCETCHSPRGWRVQVQAVKDHQNRFPLMGAHSATECESCHLGAAVGRYKGLDTQCDSCHLKDYQSNKTFDHVAAKIPTTCESCHQMNSWTGARFDHSSARFPLTGAHATVACELCHTNRDYASTSTACASCHVADFNKTSNPNHNAAGFPQDCAACHVTAEWKGAKYDHNMTRFPLTGGHAAAECRACHANGNYANTSTACASCHMTDFNGTNNPNHVAAGFSQDCSLCHTFAQWTGAKFDHNTTKFPLTGGHVSLGCSTCHTTGSYASTSTACASCHRADFNSTSNPNHTAAGFSQDCTSCHVTAQWKGAKFDHNTTKFPLTGGHVLADCSRCHTSANYATTSTVCASCHMTDYNNTSNPNHTAAGFVQDCTMCHTTVQWKGGKFDHNATRFSLTGAHVSVTCQTCHTTPNYASTSTACASCHLADFNKTTNPNHTTAGFPQDCTACHTTVQWLGATFNHGDTKFPLTGAHVPVACQTCHTTPNYASTSTACASCHLTNFNSTTNPNHVLAGFGQDCSPCHTTVQWTGATFNHGNTKFPLTGTHVTVTCQTCHTSGSYASTPTTCVSCHLTDFNGANSPNHTTAGFPQDCSTCHTTVQWMGAVFDHSKTGFVLTGVHLQTACALCHPNGRFVGTPTTCSSCHLADFQGTNNPNHTAAGFPQDCSLCHSAAGWPGAQYTHPSAKFTLTGFHITLNCSACHANGQYATLSTTCVTCHLSDYNGTTSPTHATYGFPQDCTVCHATTAWTPASFSHATTNFALTGAHVSVTCVSCHIGGVFKGTPTTCYACHKTDYTGITNPNHVAAGFPTTCSTCHTTTVWTGATFTHSQFPINSGHHARAWTSCADCHTNANDYKVFSCTGCHQHDKASVDSHHRSVRNYVYNSANCYSCHPNGSAG